MWSDGPSIETNRVTSPIGAAGGGPQPSMFDLSNHVAVVTGGSAGLGLGCARGLVKCGASVAIWSRSSEKLAAAAAELGALGCRDVLTLEVDVAVPLQIQEAMKLTLAHFGRVDSFFANAGKARATPLLETDVDAYRAINAVNFEGMLNGFREAARHMIDQRRGGKLIATSSTAAIMGSPDLVAYTAAKGAMAATVRALAVELGPHNIQVNAILPGMFRTAMTNRVEGLVDRLLPRIPSTFIAEPRHIEGIAVFLASRESDYVTGACIPVDGGLSIAWNWS